MLSDQREARLAFVMRWQQFTGPIVAKGVEDTSLYVYYPLLSLNEVGGDAQPSAASSKEDFANFLSQRQSRWPYSLNATTTHDTKRSEDVRARINVLSEVPEQWEVCLKRWAELNAVHKQDVNGQLVPDGNEEYFIYQTLLGVYPADGRPVAPLSQRLQDHIVKATREAMVHTRWTRPNLAHEQGLAGFVGSILCPDKSKEFLDDFLAFHVSTAFFGMINSLSQTLLKIACPGVPDFYQGSELWDLRLVDPDNRGSVDFELSTNCLRALFRDDRDPIQRVADLLTQWTDGRIKLWLIHQALRFRYRHHLLFASGECRLLDVTDSRTDRAICFLRRHGREWAVIVVPRWLAHAQAPAGQIPSPEFWADTLVHLPSPGPTSWHNALTGERIAASRSRADVSIGVGDVLRHFPVALLSTDPSESNGRNAG